MFKNLGKIICLATTALLCSEGNAMHSIAGTFDVAQGGAMKITNTKVVSITDTGRVINKGSVTKIDGADAPGAITIAAGGSLDNIEDFAAVPDGPDKTATLTAYGDAALTGVQRPSVPFFHNATKKDAGITTLWTAADINAAGTGLTLTTESIAVDYNGLEAGTREATIYDLVATGDSAGANNLLTAEEGGGLIIDPSDPTNPDYNGGTAPAGIETVEETRTRLILPANLGCKAGGRATTSALRVRFGAHFTTGVNVGVKKVKLTGNNQHYTEGAATIEPGVTLEIGGETGAAMLKSNITVQGTAAVGVTPAVPGIFTFAPTAATTYTLEVGKTLSTTGAGQIIVPENAILSTSTGIVTIGAGTTATIAAGGTMVF